MRRFILASLVVGLVVGVDNPMNDDEATALEGTWVIVSVTGDGKEIETGKGAKLTFKGRATTLKFKGRDQKATVKIDPKNKTIDLTPDERNQGTTKGIYRLRGDELTICHGHPGMDPPNDFTAERGSGCVLIVLKRDKSE
jgi:uncharacterized protein (TIGR03067 family)